MGDQISGENQFCGKSELFGPPFCVSISNDLRTQILHPLLDFNEFRLIEDYLSQTFEISTN